MLISQGISFWTSTGLNKMTNRSREEEKQKMRFKKETKWNVLQLEKIIGRSSLKLKTQLNLNFHWHSIDRALGNPIETVTKGLAVCVCKLSKIKYPNNKAARFKCTKKKQKTRKPIFRNYN